MSNIKEYTDICNDKADKRASEMRGLAGILGREADQMDEQTPDVLRMAKSSLKAKATDMQNLVREMADQLEAERAEVRRMKRLYALARKDSRESQETIISLMGDKEEAMLAEVELQRTINELKATMGYDPMFHRKNVGKDGTISF